MTCRVMRRVLHPKTPCKTCFPGPYRWWVVCDRVYLTSTTATDLGSCLPARTQGNINFSTQYNTERSTDDWTTPVVVYDRVYLTSAIATDLGSCLPARTLGKIEFFDAVQHGKEYGGLDHAGRYVRPRDPNVSNF